MKAALCLSGHFRTFDRCFSSLEKNIINVLNPDIFIYTSVKMGYANNFRSDNNNLVNSTIFEYLEKIYALYKPVKILINDDNDSFFINEANIYAPHLRNEPKHPGHMASMYFKIKSCNNLKINYELENNFKYDLVIRCRPDLMFTNSFEIDTLNHLDKLIVPNCHNYNGINDQFAYSNSTNMDTYSSVYDYLPEYFSKRGEFFPEKVMVSFIKKSNLSIKHSNINYNIVR